jgi:hypothetical protein
MSSPAESYVNGIYEEFKLYAAWEPNLKLRLGHIGVLENNLFRYRFNLETLGIRFGTRPISEPINRNHSSGFTFETSAGGGGQASAAAPVNVAAKVQVSFNRSGAFIFQVSGSRNHEIADKMTLAKQLTDLCLRGIWDESWFLVESLDEVEKATIIVANSDDGQLEISTNMGFPAAVPLASAQGTLAITRRVGDCTSFLGQQGLTPTFGLLRVKPSWFDKLAKLFRKLKDKVSQETVPIEDVHDVLEWHQEWRK